MSNLPRSVYGREPYGTFRYGEGPEAALAASVATGPVTLAGRLTRLRALVGTLTLGGATLTGAFTSIRRIRLRVGTRPATHSHTATGPSARAREDR